MNSIPPQVSIVISTKNEEMTLANCLESIVNQTYKSFEIIVVDNYSTDNTLDIARNFTNKVFLKGPERASQRNYGLLEKSQGEYGMYIDADMILTPTLLEECVNDMQVSNAIALYIPEIVLGKSLFAKVRRFERSFYTGTTIDACRFFRTSEFRNLGGFDDVVFQTGSGEDWDLDKRFRSLGPCKVLPRNPEKYRFAARELTSFCKLRGVEHSNEFTGLYHDESDDRILDYLKKKGYYARGFDGYIEKWGMSDPDIREQFGVFNRIVGIYVKSPQRKKLVKRMDLFLLLIALRITTGIFVFSVLAKRKILGLFSKS